ncbi:MAG: hypothetical protein V7L23_11360 [Nostoc sp.]
MSIAYRAIAFLSRAETRRKKRAILLYETLRVACFPKGTAGFT